MRGWGREVDGIVRIDGRWTTRGSSMYVDEIDGVNVHNKWKWSEVDGIKDEVEI